MAVLERSLNTGGPKRCAPRSAAGGRPVQVIAPSLTLPLPVIDLRPAGGGTRGGSGNWQGRRARKPFDLRAGPLLRTILYRLGDGEHILFLALHHVVSDGWSLVRC